MGSKPKLVDEISDRLCDQFQVAVPLRPDVKKHDRKPSLQDIRKNSELALKDFYKVANEEKVRHGLGVIGSARVIFGLQQRLLNAGYDSSLVKQVLLAMLASVFVGNRN